LAVAILIGFIFFGTAYLRGKLTANDIGFKSAYWLVPYLLGLTLISYLGAFGGKNVIPFGWDFLVIAIFSVVMLYVAVLVRSRRMAADYADFHLLEPAAI
jgi:hypothetical protein